MNKKFLILAFSIFLFQAGLTQIRLPALVRDSMVLQRDEKLKIWGWASRGEKIRIKFNGKTTNATAKEDGKWIAVLPPIKAGGPHTTS